ncbi:hypothetical protein GCM10009415_01140 [Chitinophaga japonensis]
MPETAGNASLQRDVRLLPDQLFAQAPGGMHEADTPDAGVNLAAAGSAPGGQVFLERLYFQ